MALLVGGSFLAAPTAFLVGGGWFLARRRHSRRRQLHPLGIGYTLRRPLHPCVALLHPRLANRIPTSPSPAASQCRAAAPLSPATSPCLRRHPPARFLPAQSCV